MTRHYPDLGDDASSVWNFCASFSDVIWQETSGSVAKCWLFSQAKFLTADQSWPWYTASGPEQEFRRWFADEIKFSMNILCVPCLKTELN